MLLIILGTEKKSKKNDEGNVLLIILFEIAISHVEKYRYWLIICMARTLRIDRIESKLATAKSRVLYRSEAYLITSFSFDYTRRSSRR